MKTKKYNASVQCEISGYDLRHAYEILADEAHPHEVRITCAKNGQPRQLYIYCDDADAMYFTKILEHIKGAEV